VGEGSSEKNCCHRIVTCSLLKCTGLNSFELALIYSFLGNGVIRSPRRRGIISLVFLSTDFWTK